MRQTFRPKLESLENREMFAALADVVSIDDIYQGVQAADPQFDLNEDNQVDFVDVEFFVEEVAISRLGDNNLDGRVNFQDFLRFSDNFGKENVGFAEGDVNGDGRISFSDFLTLSGNFGFESPGLAVSIHDGAANLPNRTIFEMLAATDDVPGALGIRQVKFVVDVARDEVYFSNQNQHLYHYHFAKAALGFEGENSDFSQVTYFRNDRLYVAGSILAHDNFESGTGDGDGDGVYTLQFWPTDPVTATTVHRTFELVRDAAAVTNEKLFYHPAGETQRALFETEAEQYASFGTPIISTEELYENQTFTALNPGVAYGRLRLVDSNDRTPLSPRDLVIFEQIPNDLTHVAGVITVAPQTPLSHVNLRAKQNDTPNAYIKNALTDSEIQGLLGKTVRFEVTGDSYTIREATTEEADAHFAAIRPSEVQFAERNLEVTEIVPLASLRLADQTAYGAKAANLGELGQVLPDEQVPDGLAVPFSVYDDFMKANGFYDEAVAMMNDPDFQADATVRDDMLDAFRDRIKDGDVPPEISAKLDAAYATLQQEYGDNAAFRSRSSTNNEDLEGFTGAGLYRSYTHRPDEGKLENTIRQVWSSLWTFRAFEEREFWRIDHLSAAMGVAIHPNFDLEEVNGVAVTKNIFDPNWTGYYVNAQVGEDLVTNPESGAIPEEFLVSRIGQLGDWEVQYIRRSNLTEDGANVLSDEHVRELRIAMLQIQSHFRRVYGRFGDPAFAMDIEFKVDRDGQLVVKQARPWVD